MLALAIKDANILIDCLTIDLLGAIFQLPMTFMTTDFILAEIVEEDQSEALQAVIATGDLQVRSFAFEQIMEIQNLADNNAGISFEDASGLYLAEQESATLLTGDGKLRRLCQQRSVEVHGIIWLLDQVVGAGVIDEATACEKIRNLEVLNPRLPKQVMEERIVRWCS